MAGGRRSRSAAVSLMRAPMLMPMVAKSDTETLARTATLVMSCLLNVAETSGVPAAWRRASSSASNVGNICDLTCEMNLVLFTQTNSGDYACHPPRGIHSAHPTAAIVSLAHDLVVM